MKSAITIALMLAGMTSWAQKDTSHTSFRKLTPLRIFSSTDLRDSAFSTGLLMEPDTFRVTYDTVKVIAEIYVLPLHVYQVADDTVWWLPRNSCIVTTCKVLAWEVWRKEYRCRPPRNDGRGEISMCILEWVPVEMIKRLAYNKVGELRNVLQTWRVEWQWNNEQIIGGDTIHWKANPLGTVADTVRKEGGL